MWATSLSWQRWVGDVCGYELFLWMTYGKSLAVAAVFGKFGMVYGKLAAVHSKSSLDFDRFGMVYGKLTAIHSRLKCVTTSEVIGCY